MHRDEQHCTHCECDQESLSSVVVVVYHVTIVAIGHGLLEEVWYNTYRDMYFDHSPSFETIFFPDEISPEDRGGGRGGRKFSEFITQKMHFEDYKIGGQKF